jgi:hypothetical protein
VDGFNATNASPWFNRIPVVGGQGSLNIGRRIEFHTVTDASTTFTIDNPSNNVLTFSGSITATGLTGSLANGVTAGNGLTGGTFNNSGNVTFAVGTPSNITSTSTNSVTSTSHTHLLADGAVTTNKIENDAVTTAKISNGSITAPKLSGGQTNAACPIYGIRAWAYITSGTTTPVRTGSGNIASVSRNGNGDYTVTFSASTPLPNSNYAVVGTCGSDGDHIVTDITDKSTTGFRFRTRDVFNNAYQNTSQIHIMVIG